MVVICRVGIVHGQFFRCAVIVALRVFRKTFRVALASVSKTFSNKNWERISLCFVFSVLWMVILCRRDDIVCYD